MTLLAVLLASLVGSLHCAAMCGGFAAACSGSSGGRGRIETATYSLGRAVVYLALGLGAGAVGLGLDLAGSSLAGVSKAAPILLGGTLIGMGLWSLFGRKAQPQLVNLGVAPDASLLGRARRRLAMLLHRPGPGASFGVGLLSGLLPCAWLWGYVAVAAATGDVLEGGLVMLVFWAGTVPALTGVGLLAGTVGKRLGRQAPRIIAVVMISLGLMSLLSRPAPTPDAPCHTESLDESQGAE